MSQRPLPPHHTTISNKCKMDLSLTPLFASPPAFSHCSMWRHASLAAMIASVTP